MKRAHFFQVARGARPRVDSYVNLWRLVKICGQRTIAPTFQALGDILAAYAEKVTEPQVKHLSEIAVKELRNLAISDQISIPKPEPVWHPPTPEQFARSQECAAALLVIIDKTSTEAQIAAARAKLEQPDKSVPEAV